MAPKYHLKIDQGATLRRSFWYRQALVDLASGDPILSEDGEVQPGPPYDLYGWTARAQIRRSVSDPQVLLELSSSLGGLVVQQLTVKMLGWAKAATTGNITLSGIQVVDGVQLAAGDRVLVKDQSTSSQNGIYVVSAGAWSRAADADTKAELDQGAAVWVWLGDVNDDTVWRQKFPLADLNDPQLWEKVTEVGRVDLTITAAQTAALSSSGVWDLELVGPGNEVVRLVEGKVRLSQEVTR
jgi:hypothetical protein